MADREAIVARSCVFTVLNILQNQWSFSKVGFETIFVVLTALYTCSCYFRSISQGHWLVLRHLVCTILNRHKILPASCRQANMSVVYLVLPTNSASVDRSALACFVAPVLNPAETSLPDEEDPRLDYGRPMMEAVPAEDTHHAYDIKSQVSGDTVRNDDQGFPGYLLNTSGAITWLNVETITQET